MAANTQLGVDLKKESEVREYLDNLGIEYRFGCYSQNDSKGVYDFSFFKRHCIFFFAKYMVFPFKY